MRPRHTSSIDGGAGAGEQAAGVVAAEEHGREVEHVAVDEPLRVEGVGDGRAALDEQLEVALGAELVEQLAEVAAVLEAGPHLGVGRRLAEHDALGVATGRRRVADGEARVVGAHGAGADEDRVALGSERVGIGPGLGTGDPLAGAVGRGGAAVERRGQLQHHVGAAGAAVVQVRGEQRLGLRRRRRPPRPRCRPPAAGRCPGPATSGSGSSMATTTRPTPASMRASAHGGVRPWCEHGSRVTQAVAPREVVVAGRGEGGRLGVRAADRRGRALEHRAVGGLDHAADPRVRRRERPHGAGELEGSVHALGVDGGGHHGAQVRTLPKTRTCSSFGLSGGAPPPAARGRGARRRARPRASRRSPWWTRAC